MARDDGSRLDPQEVADAARLYRELGSVEAVAQAMGMSKDQVSRRLAARGNEKGLRKRKAKPLTPEERAEIVRVYRETRSRTKTAKLVGKAVDRVANVLFEELGVM